MTRFRTAAALLGASMLVQPPAPARAEPAVRKGLPAEIAAYLDRRTGCRHWSGEDAYDAARGRQIAAAVGTLRCDAMEADEARLRQRHGGNPAVRKALDAAAHAD